MAIGKGVVAIMLICGATWLGPGEFVESKVVSECRSSSDCAPGRCCVIGGSRFSIPQCVAFGDEGKSCRPAGAVPTLNTTLTYPDGSVLHVEDVHYIICPCAEGLSCDLSESLCRKPPQDMI